MEKRLHKVTVLVSINNLLIVIIIGIFTIGIIGCDSDLDVEEFPPEVEPPAHLWSKTDPLLFWSKTDPLAYLDFLKNHPGSITVISQAPQDWLKEEHVSQLMQLIDSDEPAASVICAGMSYWPSKGEVSTDTVGNEAMFLIEGFRRGEYPPAACSLDDIGCNPEGLRKWWSEYQRKKSEGVH